MNDSVVGQIETFTLSNGLRVCLMPRYGANVVSLVAQVHTGSLADPVDKPGLAHLLEHLNFCGTSAFPAKDDFEEEILSREGRTNGTTFFDLTNFEVVLPSTSLEFGLHALQQLVFEPTYTEESLQAERQIVLAERVRTFPGKINALLAEMFPDTMVGREVLGTDEGINAIELDDIKKFNSRYYGPSNTTLFVVGEIPKDISSLIDSFYGSVVSSAHDPIEPCEMASEIHSTSPTKFDFWNSEQTSVDLLYHVPTRSEDELNLARIIQFILSGSTPLSLNATLRKSMGISYSATASFGTRGAVKWYEISTRVARANSVSAIRGVQSILQRLFNSDLCEEHVKRSIVDRRAADRLNCVDHLGAVRYLQRIWRDSAPHETPDSLFAKLLSIEPRSINAFAKSLFSEKPGLLLSGGVDQEFMEGVFKDLLSTSLR